MNNISKRKFIQIYIFLALLKTEEYELLIQIYTNILKTEEYELLICFGKT